MTEGTKALSRNPAGWLQHGLFRSLNYLNAALRLVRTLSVTDQDGRDCAAPGPRRRKGKELRTARHSQITPCTFADERARHPIVAFGSGKGG